MGNPRRGIVDGMPGAEHSLFHRHRSGGKCNSIRHHSCVAVVLTLGCLGPKVVSAGRAERCWRVGQMVGSCMMIAPARATDEPAHLPSLQDYVAQNKDFLVGTASAVGTTAGSYIAYPQFEQDRRQADEAFRASDEYKIKQAVEKFLRPYEVTTPQKQVVKRDVMDVVKRIISD